jgi:hypothetical protein
MESYQCNESSSLGKNQDDYFTNPDILDQIKEAIDILQKCYPNYDHVLLYNNMTTHLKHAEDTLSARYMPKTVPKPSSNWGIEVSKHNPATGKLVHHLDVIVRKIKIRMRGAQFEDSKPQTLYYPMDDPNPDLQGVFKGMEVILQEQGFIDSDLCDLKGKKLLVQCNKFKCAPGEKECCICQILYNQPDFAQAESLLETLCQA